MADVDAGYRKTLEAVFNEKKSRNKRYSLRSFAKFIGVDNGFLSKLMRGQVLLSIDVADRITKRLNLDQNQRTIFIKSAVEEQACHALYLLDPTLTDCNPDEHEVNLLPRAKDQS